ncbi:hypothetical protein [Terrisporobacter petrolearius]|uniref:hypothetical protein n=1 Tax=Terrisporobacter petrolearius TaxID=1460447 RepID=UPI0031CC4137
MIGWVALGAAAVTVGAFALVKFWDQIRMWLNNTAANAVERLLGYGARTRMHRAVATVDRVIDKIRNRVVVYTKKDELDTHYHKTTLEAEASVYSIDEGVLKNIENQGRIIQEFSYKS